MTTYDCSREQDVLDAAAGGRWPDRADAELRAHVAACRVCGDAAEVAPLFAADRDAAWQEAGVPPASSVWWRAQMRARREAAEQAARPMVLVQRAALVYAGAALFALGALVGPWLRAWVDSTARLVAWLAPRPETLDAVASTSAGLTPAIAGTIVLILAPLIVYLALDDR